MAVELVLERVALDPVDGDDERQQAEQQRHADAELRPAAQFALLPEHAGRGGNDAQPALHGGTVIRPAGLGKGSARLEADDGLLAGGDGHHVGPFGMLFVTGANVGADGDDAEAGSACILDHIIDQRRRRAGPAQHLRRAGMVGADQMLAAFGEDQFGLGVDAVDPGHVAAAPAFERNLFDMNVGHCSPSNKGP